MRCYKISFTEKMEKTFAMFDLIISPEKYCLDIRGTFHRLGLPPLIFQRSHGVLQKKTGPIIPANPKSQAQQIHRLAFAAATRAAKALTDEQIDEFRRLARLSRKRRTWHNIFVSQFIANQLFDAGVYSMGTFSAPPAPQPVARYGADCYGDGFYSKPGDVPSDIQAVATAFPNIDVTQV